MTNDDEGLLCGVCGEPWQACPHPDEAGCGGHGPQPDTETVAVQAQADALRAELEAAIRERANGPNDCSLCSMPEAMVHHIDTTAKGYHPFDPSGGA